MRSPYTSLLHDLFPRRLQQWLGPIAAAALLGIVIALAVVWTGLLNLAASVPHPAGWSTLLHYTFKRSAAFHAGGLEPPPDINSAALIQKGAIYYDRVCSHCHSVPGRGLYAAARHLSDREIDGVALYYAASSPAAPRPPVVGGAGG